MKVGDKRLVYKAAANLAASKYHLSQFQVDPSSPLVSSLVLIGLRLPTSVKCGSKEFFKKLRAKNNFLREEKKVWINCHRMHLVVSSW